MRVRDRWAALVLMAIACLPVSALAGEGSYAVSTGMTGFDGLFFTTSGKTLKTGTLVMGGGFVYASGDGGSVSTLPFTLAGGVTDRVEAALSLPLLSRIDPDAGGSDSGIGDLDLRVKYSLQGETPELPAFAVFGHLKLATADAPQGTKKSDFGAGIAADKDFGGIQALLNLEYTVVGDDRPDGNQLNWALGLKIPYSDSTRFSVELLDQYMVTSSWVAGDFVVGGISFDLPPAIDVSFNIGLGLNETSPDVLVGAKFDFTL
jgi:hypothetical protein